ncbi:MAG: RnfABCDGE type electron transport complex subunit D [Clostridiales bacterium]|nr:RnfABCDGE type electron transport complex subunit D [Clostridiales bacterium]
MDKKFHTNLIVSSAPHIVTESDTTRLMGTVILALVPAWAASIYIFGFRALLLSVVCVAASVLFEYLYNVLMHKKQTVGDLSAALTGLLIAFNVPSNFPIWQAIIGCLFAIVVVKQLFGGIGRNFSNPAITARIFLFISFSANMSTWPLTRLDTTPDAVTGPTPLAILAEGNTDQLPGIGTLFLGFHGGSTGEVCALALIIGGVFLIVRKVISPVIPCAFIGTVFVYGLIATGSLEMALWHVLAGGVLLGAFFMATDYVTSPKLPLGQLIFGIGCGIITMSIRLFGSYPEGVSFSILLMNICTPLLNNLSYKFYLKEGGAKNGK